MAAHPFVDEYGDLSNEIQLNVAEILTLRLPEGPERIIASKWMKKFLACDPKAYRHNLSLFISCLTKKMLVKPFDEAPHDTSSQWQSFDREYTRKDINAGVVHRLYRDSFTPPCKYDLSQNLKEYLSFQEIPFFGAHCYYAFSPTETIDKWNRFNKMNIPRRLIEGLLDKEEPESPIKGRFHPKPKKIDAKATKQKAKIVKTRDGWQDLILTKIDEEEPAVERREMISLPANENIGKMPPALQRRMQKAEQERLERLAQREQEKSKKDERSRVVKPKKGAVLGKKKSNESKKLPKMPKMDEIDAALAAAPEPPLEKSPVPKFTGPKAQIQERLFHLRRSNPLPPAELIQATRDMNFVTRSINKEAERLTREGTPNLDKVEIIHVAGVDIGNRVLKMMKAEAAKSVQSAAVVGHEAVKKVQLTMDQLNEMLGCEVKPREETVARLRKIKENMAQAAAVAENIAEEAAASEAVGALNEMAQVSRNALSDCQPKSTQEKVLVEGLESSNREISSALEEQSGRLKKAIEEKSGNLSEILRKTKRTVDEILSMSFERDNALDEAPPEIQQKQHEKNERLEEIRQEIDAQVETNFRAAASNPMVAKYLPHASDSDNDIIDLSAANIDFGATVDDAVMQEERAKQRRRRTLVEVDDSENLLNISGGIVEDIDKSIELIEDEIIPGLQQAVRGAASEDERLIIENAMLSVASEVEALRVQRSALDEEES